MLLCIPTLLLLLLLQLVSMQRTSLLSWVQLHLPALLLYDLDHFKHLDDNYGHDIGDEALVAFTRIAVGSMRKQDVFSCIGEGQFACLLADADDEAGAQVAERIRREFSELPFQEPGEHSVNIGIVSSRDAGYDLFRLLSLADDALYAAKHTGKNRVWLFLTRKKKDA